MRQKPESLRDLLYISLAICGALGTMRDPGSKNKVDELGKLLSG